MWFALDESPLFAFADICTVWTGARGTKANPIEGDHLLYGFLTTKPNGVVGPIHPKAMLLILDHSDWERWFSTPLADELALQQLWSDFKLRIGKQGADKQDCAPEAV